MPGVGDVILTQDGIPVRPASTLYADKRLRGFRCLWVWREGKIRSVVVTLSRPQPASLCRLAVPLVAAAFWFSGTPVLFLSSSWRRQVHLLFLYTQLAAGSLASIADLVLITCIGRWRLTSARPALSFAYAFPRRLPDKPCSSSAPAVLRGFYVVGILLALSPVACFPLKLPSGTFCGVARLAHFAGLAMIGSIGLLLHIPGNARAPGAPGGRQDRPGYSRHLCH